MNAFGTRIVCYRVVKLIETRVVCMTLGSQGMEEWGFLETAGIAWRHLGCRHAPYQKIEFMCYGEQGMLGGNVECARAKRKL